MSQLNLNSGEVAWANLFECPICYEYILPPIYQCENGHLVCNRCKPNFTRCPTCRGLLENFRNLALEELASRISFSCKYSENGCRAVIKFIEKPDHENTCDFRPYCCPCPECEWQGSLEEVVPHIHSSHETVAALQGDDIVFMATDINCSNNVNWVMIQSCFGHNFILVVQKKTTLNDEHQFFAYAQLIGSREQAKNFSYRMRLTGNQQRLTWEAVTKSIHEGVGYREFGSYCFYIDELTAQRFSEDGNLFTDVKIFKI